MIPITWRENKNNFAWKLAWKDGCHNVMFLSVSRPLSPSSSGLHIFLNMPASLSAQNLWTLLKHSSSDFTSLPPSQPWGVRLHILIVVIRQLATLIPTNNVPAPLPNWTTVFLTMWLWQDRSYVQFLEKVLTGWRQSVCPISLAITTGLGMDQVGPSTSVKFNLLEYVLQCCWNNG